MTQSIESMIEVLQAFNDGKKIEFLTKIGTWEHIDKPCFDFSSFQYRIAPKSKKRVHYSCWSDEGQLRWIADSAAVPADWIRAPSEDEDKEILI